MLKISHIFPFEQVTMGGASSLIQHKNLRIDDDIHIRSFQTSLKFESAGDEASDALRVKLLTTVLPLFMAQLDDDNIVNSIRENVIAMNAVKVIDDVELKHVIPKNNQWLATLISSVEHLDLIVSVATARADRPGFPLIYVNKSFERVMQYDRSAIIGTNCKFLQSDKTDLKHIEILSDALQSAKPVKVTLVNKRKDGTEFNNLLSLCPVFDKEGVYSYVIGVQTDLSVREPTEAKMQLVDDLTRELSNLSALLY